jgi:hypothetical protein
MHALPLLALLAFTVAGLFHGLRIRRTSFTAGTRLPRNHADRQATGWFAWFFLEHPRLCRVLDAISDRLPGGRSLVEDTVSSSTTFTRLQSRTLLHRYFRWQLHNLMRSMLALLFCGAILVCLPRGLTHVNHLLIAGGSVGLFLYAFICFRRIRLQNEATAKVCGTAAAAGEGNGDEVLGAFSELAEGAMRQAIAFGLVYVINLGLQVVFLVDTNNQLSFNADLERAQTLELLYREDPTAFADHSQPG